MRRDWHEECGVTAVYRRDGNTAELAHRGQEAAGIRTLGPTDEPI